MHGDDPDGLRGSVVTDHMNRPSFGMAQNQATFPSWVIGVISQDLSSENCCLYIGQENVFRITFFFRMKADLILSSSDLFLDCMDFYLREEGSTL
jgi:hypothetical protein